MDPTSFMPNATKGNLENFEKKHMKWIKFNVLSQHILLGLGLVVVAIYFWAEYLIK